MPNLSNPTAGGSYTYVQSGEPDGPTEGETWYDTDAKEGQVYTGSTWVKHTVDDHSELAGVASDQHHARPTGTGSAGVTQKWVRVAPYHDGSESANHYQGNGLYVTAADASWQSFGDTWEVVAYFSDGTSESFRDQDVPYTFSSPGFLKYLTVEKLTSNSRSFDWVEFEQDPLYGHSHSI